MTEDGEKEVRDGRGVTVSTTDSTGSTVVSTVVPVTSTVVDTAVSTTSTVVFTDSTVDPSGNGVGRRRS